MTDAPDIVALVRGYVLEELLPDEDPDRLERETPLLSTGVLDSISVLRLVSFLEERLGVEFEPWELTEENLETVGRIAALVESKLRPTGTG